MKTMIRHLAVIAASVYLAWTGDCQANLIHRYSFATDASDSVGNANGTLVGTTYVANGAANFDGTIDPVSYIELPGGLVQGLTSTTIEFWTTVDAANGGWSRIFDFGDVNGTVGRYYIMFTPNSGGGLFLMSYADADPGYNHEFQPAGSGSLNGVGPTHVACVYDSPNGTLRLYTNGVLVNLMANLTIPLSSIYTNYCWLGRSLYAPDASFTGSIDEFRIYDKALGSLEVAASYLSGVSSPSTDAAALGAVQALHLDAKTVLNQADVVASTLSADFAKLAGVSLKGIAGVTYETSNSKVVSVSATGDLTAGDGGTATVTATFQGVSDSVEITVNRRVGIAVAGTLYVDLRAADFVAGAAVWTNRTGLGDFDTYGSSALAQNVENTGIAGVQFNGTSDAFAGPYTTDDLDGASDRSIEVWVYNPAIAAEETLVAWGHRGTGLRNMSFNYGSNGSYGAAGHWDADVGWNGTPPAGVWHYLVYTYDGTVSRVYADGALKNQRTVALNTFPGEQIRLGAQGNTAADGFDFGQALSGYIALVRVHGGAFSDQDVFNNFLYGSSLASPGALQGVKIQLNPSPLLVDGFGQARVLADYANRSNVNVTAFAKYVSSDTNVVTVNKTGLITTLTLGSATLSASFEGMQATQSVQVVSWPASALKHRYSFNDATTSTTAKDSVGTANGTLNGGATLSGTEVALNGTDGYVDLPNGIISSLTNTTFEAWVTWNGPADSPWQRIFDFGTSDGGEDVQGTGVSYLYLTPRSGGGLVQYAANGGAGETPVLYGSKPLDIGTEDYVAMVYNYDAQKTKIFVNGQVVASGQATIPLKSINDVNNWLGRSQYNDPWYNGTINEFRIYDGALTDAQIAASFAAGPNTLPVVSKPNVKAVLANGAFVITWPVDSAGFTLETTPVLGQAAQWAPVSGQPTVENGQNKVTIPTTDAVRFYRLKK